jgi:hypothetical protein
MQAAARRPWFGGAIALCGALVLAPSRAAEPKAKPEPAAAVAKPGANGWRYTELRRFPAAEAGQGVAVDAEYFYAINNATLGKYRKTTGERVAVWDGGRNGPWIHLNAGLVHGRRLWAAHSNYPAVPMQSSVEIFDLATLRPAGSHSFGRTDGSLTWIDRREGRWIACFFHYGKRGGEPGKGPEWTYLAEFDDAWRRLRGWTLPADLVAAVGGRGYSLSGGAIGPGGFLFVTGHDEPELYVLEFPVAGAALRWVATIPIPAEGQAFAWDPAAPGMLYAILKRKREVIVGRVDVPAP